MVLGSRIKMLRNKCYHEFLPSKLDFPPHTPPPDLTYFPDYVRNPDERPMSVPNFTSDFFGIGVTFNDSIALIVVFKWLSFTGS